MVINEEKPKEPVQETPWELKERLLREISEQSVGVIALAHVYAKNFESLGVDVTKAWITTEQQTRVLEAVYKKGVDDTIFRLRNEGRLCAPKNGDNNSDNNSDNKGEISKKEAKRRERELQREKYLEKKRNSANSNSHTSNG